MAAFLAEQRRMAQEDEQLVPLPQEQNHEDATPDVDRIMDSISTDPDFTASGAMHTKEETENFMREVKRKADEAFCIPPNMLPQQTTDNQPDLVFLHLNKRTEVVDDLMDVEQLDARREDVETK